MQDCNNIWIIIINGLVIRNKRNYDNVVVYVYRMCEFMDDWHIILQIMHVNPRVFIRETVK